MNEVVDQLSQHEQTGVVPASAGKLSPEEFMKFVDETRAQPTFRTGMDKCADYYDGNQLTAEVLQNLDQMGFTSLMTNLIKPAIDTVLGIEAKTRADFRMVSDDDANQDVAEALSQRLKEAEREARADRACSDAYGGQVKSGLGWVHVTRNSDPFAYPYKVESVHRREMSWDWAAKDAGLDDARYLIRTKWFPTDQVTAALPQHAPLINASGGGWQPDWLQRAQESAILMNAFDQESRIPISAWDWRNIDNRRVALMECWYATFVRGLVLDLGDKVVEFNQRNPLHMAAVGTGKVKPMPAVYRKRRCSMWFGPHSLQDEDSGRRCQPYVPFWGFREDLTGVPYGLIRNMIPLQDEVNARRRKLMWLLSSKRVQMDSDALDQRYTAMSDVVDEIARPDSMLITNPARTNKDAIKVESDLGLSQQQFEILTEAKEGIQAAAGLFNSIMGKTDGAKSGIAVNSLVEQASNTLGEINDNFKFSRQLVGERLVELIREDLRGKEVKVMVGPQEARRKSIFLNTPKVDALTGQQYTENDTEKAVVKVALEDVPSTPAYRAQQQMMLGEVLKSLPPALQAAMMPFVIEATDLPKRHEMAALARKTLGQAGPDGEPQDPQVMQLTQQLQQLHAQSEQTNQHYEQAVKEQSDKASALAQQVEQLKLQVANKAGEIEVRRAELDLQRSQDGATAQERLRKLDLEAADREFKAKALELERNKLAVEAAAKSADHAHRTSEIEHAQLLAATPVPAEAVVDPATAFQQEKELVQLKGDLDLKKATEVAKLTGETQVKVAELRASATPATLTPEQEAAADEEDGEEGGEATPPAKPAKAAKAAAPKKKSVVFTYKDGKLSGAHVNGKPVAVIKRGADGSMTGADLVS